MQVVEFIWTDVIYAGCWIYLNWCNIKFIWTDVIYTGYWIYLNICLIEFPDIYTQYIVVGKGRS